MMVVVVAVVIDKLDLGLRILLLLIVRLQNRQRIGDRFQEISIRLSAKRLGRIWLGLSDRRRCIAHHNGSYRPNDTTYLPRHVIASLS